MEKSLEAPGVAVEDEPDPDHREMTVPSALNSSFHPVNLKSRRWEFESYSYSYTIIRTYRGAQAVGKTLKKTESKMADGNPTVRQFENPRIREPENPRDSITAVLTGVIPLMMAKKPLSLFQATNDRHHQPHAPMHIPWRFRPGRIRQLLAPPLIRVPPVEYIPPICIAGHTRVY